MKIWRSTDPRRLITRNALPKFRTESKYTAPIRAQIARLNTVCDEPPLRGQYLMQESIPRRLATSACRCLLMASFEESCIVAEAG
jgi:hypothetical protein